MPVCRPHPAANSTYFNAQAGTCVPCMKGYSTFGCAATNLQACHKPCGPGNYWNATMGVRGRKGKWVECAVM